ncbi:uncharacterized protein LOC141641938 [Silene latifolia]|uniref:uncharacterized protein LOC141641938 n=1 Tax=Silene latifolia TaxID=37657 RepID=UPI003D776E4D
MEEQKLKHVCKFCKKRFACGRSLGGHIRCHLPKPGKEQRKKKQKSNATTSSVSSETEAGNLRLSKRSCLAGNSSYSSLSEVVEEEQQQQEVDIAMCLIMLSRDMGPWGDGKSSHGKSSKNKRKRVEKVQGKKMNAVFTAVNGEKQKLVSVASENLQKGVKMKGIEVSENGFLSNEQSFNLSENRSVKMKECRESKTGFLSADLMSNDHELGKFDENQMKTELFTRRSKFDCVTCNKVFHSYQALGGHKASHKKLQEEKDWYNPLQRDEKAILSIAECSSPDSNEKFTPKYKDEVFTDIGLGSSPTLSKKIAQKHECPICFRVFSSGQALGGHKRSHFLACNDNEAKISQSNQLVDDVIERSSSSKPRDMLDLNLLPEHVHEEDVTANCTTSVSSSSIVGLIKPYCNRLHEIHVRPFTEAAFNMACNDKLADEVQNDGAKTVQEGYQYMSPASTRRPSRIAVLRNKMK